MIETISNFFVEMFTDVTLATILISMIPIIELRGAIPFATNTKLWGAQALTNWSAFSWSLLGSSAIVFILAALFIPIMKLLKKTKLFRKTANEIESNMESKAARIKGSKQKCKPFSSLYWKKFFAILILVAIPLPLTGIWTGTCLAIFIGLDYLSTCCCVIAGNTITGLIITLILEFFPALNNYLFFIFMIIVGIVLIFYIIKSTISKHKKDPST